MRIFVKRIDDHNIQKRRSEEDYLEGYTRIDNFEPMRDKLVVTEVDGEETFSIEPKIIEQAPIIDVSMEDLLVAVIGLKNGDNTKLDIIEQKINAIKAGE